VLLICDRQGLIGRGGVGRALRIHRASELIEELVRRKIV
jgi:hypothetical protein